MRRWVCTLGLLARLAVAQGPQVCQPVSSNLITVSSAAERQAAGAKAIPPITDQQNGFAWPDTSLGVLKTESGLVFFASDGAHHNQNNKYGSVTRTVGTLDNPLGTGSPIDVVIRPNLSLNPNYTSYTYLGGARIHAIPQGSPGAGSLLVVYHAEINTATSFYSLLGLALSSDGGGHWTDLGEIIRPNQPYAKDLAGFDIGSEPLNDFARRKLLLCVLSGLDCEWHYPADDYHTCFGRSGFDRFRLQSGVGTISPFSSLL